MITYDIIGRVSGNFPITEEEDKRFEDLKKYMHSRIMEELL